jgi:hypothetical protein
MNKRTCIATLAGLVSLSGLTYAGTIPVSQDIEAPAAFMVASGRLSQCQTFQVSAGVFAWDATVNGPERFEMAYKTIGGSLDISDECTGESLSLDGVDIAQLFQFELRGALAPDNFFGFEGHGAASVAQSACGTQGAVELVTSERQGDASMTVAGQADCSGTSGGPTTDPSVRPESSLDRCLGDNRARIDPQGARIVAHIALDTNPLDGTCSITGHALDVDLQLSKTGILFALDSMHTGKFDHVRQVIDGVTSRYKVPIEAGSYLPRHVKQDVQAAELSVAGTIELDGMDLLALATDTSALAQTMTIRVEARLSSLP